MEWEELLRHEPKLIATVFFLIEVINRSFSSSLVCINYLYRNFDIWYQFICANNVSCLDGLRCRITYKKLCWAGIVIHVSYRCYSISTVILEYVSSSNVWCTRGCIIIWFKFIGITAILIWKWNALWVAKGVRNTIEVVAIKILIDRIDGRHDCCYAYCRSRLLVRFVMTEVHRIWNRVDIDG